MSIDIKDIFDYLNKPKPTVAPNIQKKEEISNSTETPGLYTIESKNWYSAKPYGFKNIDQNGNTTIMFLPISPNNLQISTNFATNIIPTLYGTIEEHSDIRYFDISIEGTTGMAPKFVEPFKGSEVDIAYSFNSTGGRASFPMVEAYSAGGFFSKTFALINEIKNKANDFLDGSSKPKTGINSSNSGYVAFHNLYLFLLKYKKDAAAASTRKRTKHPLIFFNYKDNNQYNVVVQGFVMRRSADNPMLYNYSISLRGYNLTSVGEKATSDLAEREQQLGLSGIDSSSVLGTIKSLASLAKDIVGSSIAGINILGR